MAQRELKLIFDAVNEILTITVDAFAKGDNEAAKRIEPLEETIDSLVEIMRSHHIERLKTGNCGTQSGISFVEALTNMERIADHCSNIAVCLIQVHQDSFETHEYLNTLKNSDDRAFADMYENYKSEYALP